MKTFDERNEAWKGPPRSFTQANSKSPMIWRIWLEGNVIHTEWGQVEGAQQHVEDKALGVNIGKSNEVSPADHALDLAREKCRKKNLEGYREVNAKGVLLDEAVSAEIDFDNITPSLSFYKPDNSMGPGITKKALAGKVLYSRKRNGMMKVLVNNSKAKLQILSRRMFLKHDDEAGTDYTWNDRFPHLVQAVMPKLPPKTILLGELVVEVEGKERFDLAQSYIKSLTPKVLEDMKASGVYPFYYCWDIAFWEGQDLVSTAPFKERLSLMKDLAKKIDNPGSFRANETYDFASPEAAIAHAKKHGWEGFVVIDPDEPGYGDKAYNFKGKPDRPGKFCAKLKPTWENDFVAIWDPANGHGESSTKGRYAADGKSGIKSVALHQYNRKGELVFICNCGSGMTQEQKRDLADPKLWPKVVKVEYSGRRYMSEGDETNALDFPIFVEPRTDKDPEECIDDRL